MLQLIFVRSVVRFLTLIHLVQSGCPFVPFFYKIFLVLHGSVVCVHDGGRSRVPRAERERVLLLEVGEHWLVVGVAPGSVTGIATLPRGELPEGPQASAPDFASVLARLKGGRP